MALAGGARVAREHPGMARLPAARPGARAATRSAARRDPQRRRRARCRRAPLGRRARCTTTCSAWSCRPASAAASCSVDDGSTAPAATRATSGTSCVDPRRSRVRVRRSRVPRGDRARPGDRGARRRPRLGRRAAPGSRWPRVRAPAMPRASRRSPARDAPSASRVASTAALLDLEVVVDRWWRRAGGRDLLRAAAHGVRGARRHRVRTALPHRPRPSSARSPASPAPPPSSWTDSHGWRTLPSPCPVRSLGCTVFGQLAQGLARKRVDRGCGSRGDGAGGRLGWCRE